MVASKISETLLEFAAPVFDWAGSLPSKEQLSAALTIAVTAWNSVIFDESVQGTSWVENARSLIVDPRGAALFDALVERKRTVFGADRRAIGDFDVVEGNSGEVRVRATAHRAPPKGLDASSMN